MTLAPLTFAAMSIPPFLDLPSGIQATRLSTKRGDLAALVGAPTGDVRRAPALLVPGIMGSKEDFIAVLAPLAAAGHPVTALDQRGQYESPGTDDQTAYDVLTLRLGEIDGKRALVPIGADIVGRFPWHVRAWLTKPRWRHAPTVIPLPRPFNLDNVSAKVAEDLSAKGSCNHAGHVDDLDA